MLSQSLTGPGNHGLICDTPLRCRDSDLTPWEALYHRLHSHMRQVQKQCMYAPPCRQRASPPAPASHGSSATPSPTCLPSELPAPRLDCMYLAQEAVVSVLQLLLMQSLVDLSDRRMVSIFAAMLRVTRADATILVPPSISMATFQTDMSHHLSASARGAQEWGYTRPL